MIILTICASGKPADLKSIKIFIITFSLLLQVPLCAQSDTLFADFLKHFPGKPLESKYLVKFCNADPQTVELMLQYQSITAERIVKKAPGYTLVSIKENCGAGGICEEVTLFSYSKDGELLSSANYSRLMGDCQFMLSDEPVLINDSILVVHNKEWEGDCLKGTTTNEVSKIYEFQIIAGRFEFVREQVVDLRRKFSKVSTQLLTEAELSKISKNELSEMRNELFASYGYVFRTDKWTEHFEKQEWYTPKQRVVEENELTVVELLNLKTVMRLEKQP